MSKSFETVYFQSVMLRNASWLHTKFKTTWHPTPAEKYMWTTRPTTLSAGVAPEVNLRKSVQVRKLPLSDICSLTFRSLLLTVLQGGCDRQGVEIKVWTSECRRQLHRISLAISI